jgi:hypothetical protein
MKATVVAYLESWEGVTLAEMYSSIPELPQWIAVQYDPPSDSGARYTYYTHYRNLDYACAWSSDPSVLTNDSGSGIATLYRLLRTSDEPYPGWYWYPIETLECSDIGSPETCLLDAREVFVDVIQQEG